MKQIITRIKCILSRRFLLWAIKLGKGQKVKTNVLYHHACQYDPCQNQHSLGVKLTFLYPDSKKLQIGWYSGIDPLRCGDKIKEMWEKQNPNKILEWLD